MTTRSNKIVLVALLILWPVTSIICGGLLNYYQGRHKQGRLTTTDLDEMKHDITFIKAKLKGLELRVYQITNKP